MEWLQTIFTSFKNGIPRLLLLSIIYTKLFQIMGTKKEKITRTKQLNESYSQQVKHKYEKRETILEHDDAAYESNP